MGLLGICRCQVQVGRSFQQNSFTVETPKLLRPFLLNPRHRILQYSTQQSKYINVVVAPTPSLVEEFGKEGFKPRKHSSHFNNSRVELPETFVDAFKQVTCNDSLKQIHGNAELLHNYLRSRKLPVEDDEYKTRVTTMENKLRSFDFIDQFLSEEEREKKEKSLADKLLHRLKKSVYHWEPIDYTRSKSLEYILARTSGEYAALSRIFQEMAVRDPDFEPQTLFDFGSGAGSVVWAANKYWSKSLVEHMCVDMSKDMNDIAELILRRGMQKNETVFPGIFFRQFFPVSIKRKYNLVVSSYTLLDLPSAKVRLETIDKLWRNTNMYLVLVEQGTNAGFVALNEARDYILQLHKGDAEAEVKQSHGFVFSPCPHDTLCPRYMKDHKPCNFYIKYRPMYPFISDSTHGEVFSYVVLRKGERSGKAQKWPRIVTEPLRRGGHVICRLCTSDGQLAETVLTKTKHMKPLYRCARTSSCGDFLPVEVSLPDPREPLPEIIGEDEEDPDFEEIEWETEKIDKFKSS